MSAGVPLTQLHCPTCGDKYEDFSIYSDTPEYYELMRPIQEIVETPEPWFIVCPKGHKWSVKMIWRNIDPPAPDEVQLDRYLGQT